MTTTPTVDATNAELVAAFEQRVGRGDGCWLWLGNVSPEGYGRFTYKRRTIQAHRVAYQLANGHMPPSDGAIDHLCRNRQCVNPAHLEAVSRGENVRRGLVGQPKPWLVKSHCHRGHPYDEANTSTSADGTKRRCKACHAINERTRKTKEAA